MDQKVTLTLHIKQKITGHRLGCLFKEIYSFLARDSAVPILWQANYTSVT